MKTPLVRKRTNDPITEESSCSCDEGLPTVQDIGYSPFQHLVLVLARGVCRGYLSEDVDDWDELFSIAEQHLGLVDGPVLAATCISLMRGVRADRRGTFNFRPLHCRHVSEDEAHLMLLVQAFQRRPNGQHPTEVEALVSNPKPFRTVIAARALAQFALKKTAASPLIFGTDEAPVHLN